MQDLDKIILNVNAGSDAKLCILYHKKLHYKICSKCSKYSGRGAFTSVYSPVDG